MIVAFTASANSFVTPDNEALDNFLETTIRSYGIPGLAVAVVNDTGIIYISGFGESAPGFGITGDTPFLLGSTTKTFTALAIMHLVEEGKVDLDSPVKNYLPEFRLATPEYENVITIRHLLNHTSGLSGKGMKGPVFGEDNLRDELLSLRHCIPESPPGEKYAYFNQNYRLLGLVIERTGGMKYGEFLYNEIFSPLNMKSTFAGPSGVTNLAEGHGGLFGFPFRRKQKYREGALPSGYIVSCASDIAHFLVAELSAGNGDSTVLNPEIVRMTWLPAQDSADSYAMGWLYVRSRGESNFLIHGGSLENYQSFFYLDPQSNIGFVYLMNQGGLLPMIGGFKTIREGLIGLVNGEQPDAGPGSLPVMIVTGVFLLILGLEILGTLRLKSWKKRALRKKKWKRRADLFIEFIFLFLLLFFGIKDRLMIYNLLPEIYLLICIMVLLGLLRCLTKTGILVQNHDIQFN